MSVAIELQHRFETFALDVAFEAPAGITVLYGRSGSGKSTIVNAVAGLITPERGRISIDDRVLLDREQGVVLPPHRRRVGYVFQEARLFPHLSVGQNLRYGRWLAPKDAELPGFEALVELLGLEDLLGRRPLSLSGGERQRVAIGRALLAGPRLILADEPLASLDEARKAEILPYFERLRDEISVPILYVTHSAAEVARLATTVVALEAGRVTGRGPAVEVLGDPAITPTGPRDAGALLEARIVAHHADGLTELEAGGATLLLPRVTHAPGSRIRVRIAAKEVLLSLDKPEGLSALNVLPGEIETIRLGDGPGAMVSLRTPAGRVLARVTSRSAQALGLGAGVRCYAVIKTVAIGPEDVGGGGESVGTPPA